MAAVWLLATGFFTTQWSTPRRLIAQQPLASDLIQREIAGADQFSLDRFNRPPPIDRFEHRDPRRGLLSNQQRLAAPLANAELPIERFRRGFFQGNEILGGTLFGLGDEDEDLDQTFAEYRFAVGVPLGSLDRILAVQPFVRIDSVNGPSIVDVPDTLYQVGVNLFNRNQWSDRFSTTVIVTPSVRSDFTTSENAFRLFGLGLINWQCTDAWSFSFGAIYLDRADLGILPAIGATWTPRNDLRLDLTLPRPRLSKRLWKNRDQAEGWVFLGGGIEGNTWAVTRRDDAGDRIVDELTLGGWSVLGGYETIVRGNRGVSIEGGYAFARTVEFESDETEIDLAGGLFLRAALKF